MQIDIKHQRNPALGWDVDVTVSAENKETITHVRVEINGFTRCDESPSSNIRKWHKTLVQQGVYPGENEVIVTAADQDGNDTGAEDEWQ